LINFAALLAFMGVNLAAAGRLFFREEKSQRNIITDLFIPLAGLFVCGGIWISLPITPKIIGGIWLLAGLIYLAVTTKGFRKKPVQMDFPEL
jgi:hypothetical protein